MVLVLTHATDAFQCVCAQIRVDWGVELGDLMQQELPVEGPISIVESLSTVISFAYGEFSIYYWIE